MGGKNTVKTVFLSYPCNHLETHQLNLGNPWWGPDPFVGTHCIAPLLAILEISGQGCFIAKLDLLDFCINEMKYVDL